METTMMRVLVCLILTASTVWAQPTCVAITAYRFEGDSLAAWHDGTGWIDHHGNLVTAAHLAGDDEASIETMDGGRAQVQPIAGSEIARGPSVGIAAKELRSSNRAPAYGERLTWHGTDDHWRPESAPVTVLAVGPALIITTSPGDQAGPGDSGAPLIDSRGVVLGVYLGHTGRHLRFARLTQEGQR